MYTPKPQLHMHADVHSKTTAAHACRCTLQNHSYACMQMYTPKPQLHMHADVHSKPQLHMHADVHSKTTAFTVLRFSERDCVLYLPIWLTAPSTNEKKRKTTHAVKTTNFMVKLWCMYTNICFWPTLITLHLTMNLVNFTVKLWCMYTNIWFWPTLIILHLTMNLVNFMVKLW